MSDAPQPERFSDRIAGHWQMPLLVFSLIMLAAGIWRLVPEPPPPTFDELFARALDLHDSQLYEEASLYIEKLLADPMREPGERRRLHGLMAEVIFDHESGNVVHGSTNAQRIIDHSDRSVETRDGLDAEMHRRRAVAWEWLRNEEGAIGEYRQAVAKNVADAWSIRKRILEIQRKIGGQSAEEFHAQYDEFVNSADAGDELRYWAADQKVKLYDQEGKHDQARAFLAKHAADFKASPHRGQYEYLEAKIDYHLERYDRAERQLRALRDQLVPGDVLYARTGWLLGKILQEQESPEYARTFFEDVLDRTTPGPYRVASRLGRAQALADLQRYEESLEEFKEVIRLASEDPYGSLVDLRTVRESTRGLYQRLLKEERLAGALAYLRIAATLVKPADLEAQALYAQRLGELTFTLGQSLIEQANIGQARHEGLSAKDLFIESGGHYLRLAKLTNLDGPRSSDATWSAADAYDSAGERVLAAQVLERFLKERPGSTRAPEALLRLGQTYQAAGEYEKAIERYQQNLDRYPSLPFAVKCLVPLADCFIAVEEQNKAIDILLRVIEHRPGDSIALIDRTAVQYRDALFRLGELYVKAGEYEKAIARHEESIESYPEDPRADRVTFMLAEAYRKSAARIREDLKDPKNVVSREDLSGKHRQRLDRARDLYGHAIERYRHRSEESLGDLDKLYIKLSHFQRADVIYDQSFVGDPSDLTPYAEALEVYDRAASQYQDDPMAMSAYVQMIICHLRMGNVDKARITLQRTRWALRGIPDENFRKFAPPEERRAYWEKYLAWLERTPAFAANGLLSRS